MYTKLKLKSYLFDIPLGATPRELPKAICLLVEQLMKRHPELAPRADRIKFVSLVIPNFGADDPTVRILYQRRDEVIVVDDEGEEVPSEPQQLSHTEAAA